MSRFNEALSAYSKKGALLTSGLPTVTTLAAQLNLSPRYLSDMLKQETGKTAIELIHIYLINEAKNRLKGEDLNVPKLPIPWVLKTSLIFPGCSKKKPVLARSSSGNNY